MNTAIYKNSGIYAIRNIKNGKYYIGSTNNLSKRKRTHYGKLRRNKHQNIHLQSAFNKYGETNMQWYVLTNCSPDEHILKTKEDLFINYLKSTNRLFGYNFQDAHRTRLSQESKNKISNTLKEYYKTHKNWNKGLGGTGICKSSFKGRHHTEEAKKKLSDANKGRTTTLTQRINSSMCHKGIPLSEEHKAKISLAHMGKKLSEQAKEKLRNRIITEEHRDNMKKAWDRRKAYAKKDIH